VLLGLGSILGTGVFVSLAVATATAGVWVVPAVIVAGLVAACNGLSSAALAAAHPVSGGTYEYGYRWLNPAAGFTAGWVFLLAKTASAATAALGCAGYLLALAGADARWRTPLALLIVVVLTGVVRGGLRLSTRANAAGLACTLLALISFVLAGLPLAMARAAQHLAPLAAAPGRAELAPGLQAVALLFVAFTGYGRIATLGEEAREPQRTIPRAIVTTLILSALLYTAVALVGIAAVGAEVFAGGRVVTDMAPLATVAGSFGVPGLPLLVTLGAGSAMLSVLLNLLLGLSRVVLAMARRGDLPAPLGRLDGRAHTPARAVLAIGGLIAALVCVGNVKTTWSFSAFAVLIYYALTNAATLRLSPVQRLLPPAVAWAGLIACLGLAWFVEPRIWLSGTVLILLGLLWHWYRRPQRRLAESGPA
jgi:APA family basic amino acid/polyamine antiporter